MYGDVPLCCMSCDAHMHDVANGTMELEVMRMGEEPGRKTLIVEHVNQISDCIFDGGGGMYHVEWACSAFGSRMDKKHRDCCLLLEGSHWLFREILLCVGSAQVEK
jgi:hypothetical protein